MKEELISFEAAKIAKEKKFNWGTNYYYHENTTYERRIGLNYNNKSENHYTSAPTQSLLQKWLREKYNIHIVLIPTITMYWTFKICNLGNELIEVPPYKNINANDYSTYEEALEAGLLEMLKLIK
jgi:hypothetical protein